MPASLPIGIFVAVFGLAFGSFLNVCISRLPQHESIVSPPSRCPRCGRSIRAVENIPLLSWVMLRARCRGCRQPISSRYPQVELATALLFLLSYLTFGLDVKGVATMILCFLLLGLAVMDAETFTLPDAFTLPGIGIGLIYAALDPRTTLPVALLHVGMAALSGIVALGLILLIRAIYFAVRRQEGMGLGDAKLLAMIGVWLGPALTAEVLFLGVVSAALAGMVWIAVRSRAGLRTQLPFGAFLCGGALFAIFRGEALLRWYLRFFR